MPPQGSNAANSILNPGPTRDFRGPRTKLKNEAPWQRNVEDGVGGATPGSFYDYTL